MIQYAQLSKGARGALPTPETHVALKFYVQPELIRPESTVYSSPAMHAATVLPQSGAFVLNTDKAMTDARGDPLPPCFVMERGVSLKDWMARTRARGGGQTMNSKTAIKVRSAVKAPAAFWAPAVSLLQPRARNASSSLPEPSCYQITVRAGDARRSVRVASASITAPSSRGAATAGQEPADSGYAPRL